MEIMKDVSKFISQPIQGNSLRGMDVDEMRMDTIELQEGWTMLLM